MESALQLAPTHILSYPILRQEENKTHRSLPKNGSSLPSAFLTQNHGAPKAPFSNARFVLSFNFCLHSGVFAACTMLFTSSAEKCRAKTSASTSGFETSRP